MIKTLIDVCDYSAVFAALGLIPVGGETLAEPRVLIAILALLIGLRLLLTIRHMFHN